MWSEDIYKQKIKCFQKSFDISYIKKNYVFKSKITLNNAPEEDFMSWLEDLEENEEEYKPVTLKTKSTFCSKISTSQVTKTNVSTAKAALICKEISDAVLDIPTPCQKTI